MGKQTFQNSFVSVLVACNFQRHRAAFFQESHDECVEEFWKEIKAQNLLYKKSNKMVKILKRQKIKDIHEYDFVVDVIVPFEQEGFINNNKVILLNDFPYRGIL